MRWVLPVVSMLLGVWFGVAGILMATNPDMFLKFWDTFVDRSRRAKTLEWRRDVGDLQYKVLGTVMAVIGMFVVFSMFVKLLTGKY